MSQDLVKSSNNLALVPPAAIKLAQQASREHQRATRSALGAIEHAVKAGQALIKAREICEYGLWEDFIAEHFTGSIRTAQNYMRVARHWQKLAAENPAGLASQQHALKALTAIVAPEKKKRQRAAQGKNAELCVFGAQSAGKRGPVSRASDPVAREALNVVSCHRANQKQPVVGGLEQPGLCGG